MTGDGVNDAPALQKANIGIAMADSTDAARSASDIVLTKRGLSAIISVVFTSRAIFQRMKNYTIYAVSITIRMVLGFMLLALVWQFDFPPFMVLIIAILNNSTIMTIAEDRVKPSPSPHTWKLTEIFATGVVLGGYLAVMTVIFFWAVYRTDFFPNHFGVVSLQQNDTDNTRKLASAVYLQVATMIAVYANWGFTAIEGIGWRWAGVIWLYNIISYIPLDIIKFCVRYALSGKVWDHILSQRNKFGKEERELWAQSYRSRHGLDRPDAQFANTNRLHDNNQLAIDAQRRAEIERLKERKRKYVLTLKEDISKEIIPPSTTTRGRRM